MISPARILKFLTACVALLVTSAWIAPASAQECKNERVTVTGPDKIAFRKKTQLEGGGSAMRVAIAAWEQEVAAKVGEEWNQWDIARDKRQDCENTKEGTFANRVACTISARPCRAREDGPQDAERDVTKEGDRPRKSARFPYSEGRRGRHRDRDRDWDRDSDRDRDREKFRYRWGAYDYDGRYRGYGPQYYGHYGHRHYGGYRRRHYDGYRHRHYHDHYPRTWIPSHLCGEAQLLLYECGYSVGTGSYCGHRTGRAISGFQRRHGLYPSGYPNERTMMALINVCGRR
jgi:hypothetical protein